MFTITKSQLEDAKNFQQTCKKKHYQTSQAHSWLLLQAQSDNDKFYAVFNSLWALFINFQKSDQTNDDYLKEFQAQMAMLDDYNANINDLVPCFEETLKRCMTPLLTWQHQKNWRMWKIMCSREDLQLCCWLEQITDAMGLWKARCNKSWQWEPTIPNDNSRR